MEEIVNVTKANALNAWNKGCNDVKAVLENLFGKEIFKPKNIIDQVTSFEAACQLIGEDSNKKKYHEGEPDEIAYCRMKIICKALRNGIVLRWPDHNQRKWYTWRVCDQGGSGFRFYGSFYVSTCTYSIGGSRLYVDTEEKAIYIAKHPEFSKYLDDLNPIIVD